MASRDRGMGCEDGRFPDKGECIRKAAALFNHLPNALQDGKRGMAFV